MSRISWLQYVRLAHFSHPKSDRILYRLAQQKPLERILELGVTDVHRSVRLLQVAQRYVQGTTVKYAALDPFEARDPSLDNLSLVTVHRALQASSATVRLLPGEPTTMLTNVANSHPRTDLLLIAPWVTTESLAACWSFVPRMLHATSVVLRAGQNDRGEATFREISHAEINTLAAKAPRRQAA